MYLTGYQMDHVPGDKDCMSLSAVWQHVRLDDRNMCMLLF